MDLYYAGTDWAEDLAQRHFAGATPPPSLTRPSGATRAEPRTSPADAPASRTITDRTRSPWRSPLYLGHYQRRRGEVTLGRHVHIAALAALALAIVPASAHAAVKAGAAVVDASWHVGASAGQYAATDRSCRPRHRSRLHSTRRASSYGIQSRLSARAIVVEGADGKRVAIVKNDLYIPQTCCTAAPRRSSRRATRASPRETLTMAVSHDHSSPYYSSTAAGRVDLPGRLRRALLRLLRPQDGRGRRAGGGEPEARAGGRVGRTSSTRPHRHSFGPAIADDGTPGRLPAVGRRPRHDRRPLRRHLGPGATPSRSPTSSTSRCTPSSSTATT